jgi:hypothetical protein
MFGWEIAVDIYLAALLTNPGFKAFLTQTAEQNNGINCKAQNKSSSMTRS